MSIENMRMRGKEFQEEKGPKTLREATKSII